MIIKHIVKKRLILIFSIIVGLIIFISTVTYSVKKTLDSPIQTLFYNSNGDALNIEQSPHNINDVAPSLLTYIKTEQKYKDISQIMFSDAPIKRVLSKILVDTLYSEKELTTIYLDQMYFDNGIIGIQAAAKYYFNKNLNKTSELQQLFLLSKGILVQNNDVKKQFEQFLRQLVTQQYLSQNQFNNIQNEEIDQLFSSLYGVNTYAQSYLQQTMTEAGKISDIPEEVLVRKGYRIHTNLDQRLQKDLYTHFLDEDNFPLQENFQTESGMVILEKHTGKIVALMGGREYQHNSLNRATEITRQPASIFKPLMVYAPALDNGWKTTDQLRDVPTKYGDFIPKNHDRVFHKQVSLKDSLVQSYNVPTVWLLYKMGLQKGIDYLEKFNIFDIDPRDGYKLALGFSRNGSNPLALAQAYTIFTNEGKMLEARSINEIETSSGKKLYEAKISKKAIIKIKTAKKMNELLREVVLNGTGIKANIDDQVVAGKTGTTSYDGWFVGYNDKYISAIWMGPDEVKPRNRIGFGDGASPTLLFKKFFSETASE